MFFSSRIEPSTAPSFVYSAFMTAGSVFGSSESTPSSDQVPLERYA